MNKAPFVLLGLTCLSVGLIAPELSADRPVVSRAPALASRWAQAEVVRVDDEDSGETSLARSDDGHFYADVLANGVTSHMLVDTGATLVALTGDDAQAMGIVWEPDAVQPIARGASGAVYGFPVKLDSVQVESVELRGVDAIVVPKGLGVSLLGQSFLGRLGNVEMRPDAMVLGGERS